MLRDPLLYVLLVLRVDDELVLRVAVELVLRDAEEFVLRDAVVLELLCGWRATVAELLPEPVLLPVERLAEERLTVALVDRVVVALVGRVAVAVERFVLSERLTACERLADCEAFARLTLSVRFAACERATAVFELPKVRLALV